MSTNEGNGSRSPAGWRARDGRLWFPLIKGVAVLDLNHLSAKSPPVVIEEAIIDGEPVEREAVIEIKPGAHNLALQYTGLMLGNSEQLRFRYRLDGYDHDWIMADSRRTAYYTHLPLGHYTFRVSALSSDGAWSAQDATQAICVHPQFWQTNRFRIAAGLILAGFGIFGYRRRVARFHRRAAQQESFARRLIDSQEHERKRIANELHDGLGQSLVIIARRAMISLESLDDKEQASEQLKEIAEASAYALEEVREVIFDLRPQQLDRLGLTTAISDLLERVATVNQWALKRDIETMDDLFPKEVENSLYRIVQEVVTNISKHADAANVSMEVRKKPDRIEMSISDDGCGFKVMPQAMETDAEGLGLHTIYERSRLLGGQASIHSAPGRGTTVRVSLPLQDRSKSSRN